MDILFAAREMTSLPHQSEIQPSRSAMADAPKYLFLAWARAAIDLGQRAGHVRLYPAPMSNYAAWPHKDVGVASLQLDPQNPRLPQTGSPKTQPEIIEELIAHDDVYELAKDIATQGYFPMENLLGVREEGRTVVLEGNRRLCALKLLTNHELAPEAHRAKFRKLSERANLGEMQRVPVVVAPSRDAAMPILLSRHTRTQIQAWQPPMQARFYRQLVDRGMSPSDISEQYGVPERRIHDFLRLDGIYRYACSLDLPDETKEAVRNNRTFPLTTLERLTESQPVREFLRMKPDPAEVFSGSAKDDDFGRAFGKIVTDVVTGKVNSRTVNDADSISEYVEGISAFRPAARSSGAFSMRASLAKSQGATPAVPGAKKAPRKAVRSKGVLSRGVKCFCANARIDDIVTELHRIPVDRCPNASAVLLRTLLELSVMEYLHSTGRAEACIAKLRQERNNRRDYSPTLREWLTYLISMDDAELPPLAVKAARLFLHKGEHNTLEHMDAFVHNPHINPTEKELRAIASRIEPVLKLTLSKVEKSKR